MLAASLPTRKIGVTPSNEVAAPSSVSFRSSVPDMIASESRSASLPSKTPTILRLLREFAHVAATLRRHLAFDFLFASPDPTPSHLPSTADEMALKEASNASTQTQTNPNTATHGLSSPTWPELGSRKRTRPPRPMIFRCARRDRNSPSAKDWKRRSYAPPSQPLP